MGWQLHGIRPAWLASEQHSLPGHPHLCRLHNRVARALQHTADTDTRVVYSNVPSPCTAAADSRRYRRPAAWQLLCLGARCGLGSGSQKSSLRAAVAAAHTSPGQTRLRVGPGQAARWHQIRRLHDETMQRVAAELLPLAWWGMHACTRWWPWSAQESSTQACRAICSPQSDHWSSELQVSMPVARTA